MCGTAPSCLKVAGGGGGCGSGSGGAGGCSGDGAGCSGVGGCGGGLQDFSVSPGSGSLLLSLSEPERA